MKRVQQIVVGSALAVAAVVSVAVVSPSVVQAAQVSQAVGKALAEAQSLVRAGKIDAAASRAQAALAASVNGDERAKSNEMLLYVYTSGRRWSEAARLGDQLGLSAKQRFGLHYNAGNFPKALELAKALPNDIAVQGQVPQIYLRQNKLPEAKKAYQDLIAKSGDRKEFLQGLAAVQFKLGEKQDYIKTLSKLIRLDPSTDNWRRLLNDLKNQQMPDVSRLALYQLMYETGNLTDLNDVEDMAKIAIVSGAPGLAASVLKEKAPTSNLNNTAGVRAAQAASGLNANVAAAKTGPQMMTVGRTFFGMGNYAKAAELFQRAAAAKADAGEANLSLGVAMAKSNRVADARKAFAAVPAASPYNDVAQLWNLFMSLRR